MKYWIIGLFLLSIIGGAISLSLAFAADNETLNPEQMSQEDKVNASALTCIISNSGDYVLDLRIRNPGTENRTVTIYPSGKKVDVLANQTKRYDLHLAHEVRLLNLSVDNETLLQVESPPCTTAGYSGSGASGSGYSQPYSPPGQSLPLPTSPQPSPAPTSPAPQPPLPPPVAELSTLVLTLAGISGLMLISRIRRG